MVANRPRRSNVETRRQFDVLRVRANLLLRGESLGTIARRHGVSRQQVDKLLRGYRPGFRGKSVAIVRDLEKAAR